MCIKVRRETLGIDNWRERLGIKVGRKLKEKAGGHFFFGSNFPKKFREQLGEKGGKPQTVFKPLIYIQ